MRFLNGQTNSSPHNYVKEAQETRDALLKKLYDEGNSLTQIMAKANAPATVVFSVVPDIRKRCKGGLLAKEKSGATTIEQRNKDICAKRANGSSVVDLAAEYELSSPMIYQICRAPATPVSI
jgi:Mor family transcriptional regulator